MSADGDETNSTNAASFISGINSDFLNFLRGRLGSVNFNRLEGGGTPTPQFGRLLKGVVLGTILGVVAAITQFYREVAVSVGGLISDFFTLLDAILFTLFGRGYRVFVSSGGSGFIVTRGPLGFLEATFNDTVATLRGGGLEAFVLAVVVVFIAAAIVTVGVRIARRWL